MLRHGQPKRSGRGQSGAANLSSGGGYSLTDSSTDARSLKETANETGGVWTVSRYVIDETSADSTNTADSGTDGQSAQDSIA
jgi:hypothetical protein